MAKRVTFTSTLPEEIINSVNDYSEKNKISKNKVLESALRQFFFNVKQESFREGFRRASMDPEMKSLAEEGMKDYLDILNQDEKAGR
ncbi:MAG: hypothetical protein ACOYNC_00480 [Bacteroidales bacterium]